MKGEANFEDETLYILIDSSQAMKSTHCALVHTLVIVVGFHERLVTRYTCPLPYIDTLEFLKEKGLFG